MPQLLGTHISETAFLLFLLSSRLPSLVDTVDVVLKLLKGIQSMRIQLFKISFSVLKWYLEDEQGVLGEGLCLPVKSSTSNLADMVEDETLSQRTIRKV